jgi:hypothetical protein
MRKIGFLIALMGIMLVPMLYAAPAHAQATRTWVSGVGDDANPCSRTAPCKTFAGAISKTAALGEINVLDPGGFGAVTITKSISIIADHVEAGVLVSGTNGIIVNAGVNDKVLLEGLDIEGLGTGINGVSIIAGGKTTVRRCSIRNFTQNGVNLAGPASARVYIIETLMLNNNGGLNVAGISGAANFGTIVNTIIDEMTTFGVQVNGAANKITMSNSVLSGSPTAISNVGPGTVISLGPSNFLTGAGTPTSVQAFN